MFYFRDTVLADGPTFLQINTLAFTARSTRQRIGTLRSNDADDNENVKKTTIGLIGKTTTSHVHHTILYISFPFLHDYDVKMPDFLFYGGRTQAMTKFYFSF